MKSRGNYMVKDDKEERKSALDDVTDKDVEEFMKENMAIEVTWNNRVTKKPQRMKNVPVIPQGLHCLIITKKEVIMVNWIDIMTVRYPRTKGSVSDKNIRYTILGIEIADNNADMFRIKQKSKPDDRAGFG